MSRRQASESVLQALPGYLPPDRRRCRQCNMVMRPSIGWRETKPAYQDAQQRYHSPEFEPTRIEWYGYGRENLFCTLRCGYAFACDLIKNQSA